MVRIILYCSKYVCQNKKSSKLNKEYMMKNMQRIKFQISWPISSCSSLDYNSVTHKIDLGKNFKVQVLESGSEL